MFTATKIILTVFIGIWLSIGVSRSIIKIREMRNVNNDIPNAIIGTILKLLIKVYLIASIWIWLV